MAGIVGHVAVEVLSPALRNRFATAFNCGAAACALAAVAAATQWPERYGERSSYAPTM